jgi:type II secretory pathway component PulF
MSVLVKAGVSIDRALETAQKTVNNIIIEKEIAKLVKSVQSGKSISESMKAHPMFFEPMAIGMVEAGSQSGKIREMFNVVGVYYKKEAKMLTENLEKFIQPILLLVIATVLLVVALAMFMPIFSIGSVLQT